jgi:hypothetical protein
MRMTKVGTPFIPGVTTLKEDLTYNYTGGGHNLILSVSNPARGEIHAVQNQDAAFGLCVREDALFILVKFGRLPWQATYFNWWINAPIKPSIGVARYEVSVVLAGELHVQSNGARCCFQTLIEDPRRFTRVPRQS